MSAATLSPRPAPVGGHAASAYVLCRRLTRRYQELVSAPAVDVEQLMHQIWRPNGGTLTDAQLYGTAESEGFIDRLDEAVPELLDLMRPDELQALAPLLDCAAPDLPALVRHVLGLGQQLQKRENDPRLKLNDAANARAAGLGAHTRRAYTTTALAPDAPRTARQQRRDRERANRAARLGMPDWAAAMSVAVVTAPPAPMVQFVPLAAVYPQTTRRKPRRDPRPAHGVQLGLWG